MTTCHRCGRGFKGDELYCPVCEEFENQVHRENNGYSCQHCGTTFTVRAAFDRHAWQIYYRDGYRPIGRRVKL